MNQSIVFLNRLYDIMGNDSSDSDLFDLLVNNAELPLSIFEITSFLSSFHNAFAYPAYTICGSGGSRLSKPNISSVAALYLSILGLPIIKVGSVAKTGMLGSSDFFKSINLLNKTIVTDKCRFSYYDVATVARWKEKISILSINKSFSSFFKQYNYNEFKCFGKMVGCLGKDKSVAYLLKKPINVIGPIFSYYSYINQCPIDECVGSEVYINSNHLKLISYGEYIEYTAESISTINKDLLSGRSTDPFWFYSLRNTVALSLYSFKQAHSMSEAYEIFDNSYKRKAVFHMLKEFCDL